MAYRIGAHRFDPDTGEVTTPEGTVRLEPQPARVLLLLAEARGALVTRDELRQTLWPAAGASFDDGINYCIREIRKAFHEGAEDPQVVETLPRRGYRLMPTVRRAEEVAAVAERVPPGPTARRRRSAAVLLVSAAGVLAVLAVTTFGEPGPTRVLLLPPGPAPGAAARPELGAKLSAALTAAATNGARCVALVGPATTGLDPSRAVSDVEAGRRHDAELVVSGFHGAAGDAPEVFLQVVRVSDGAHLEAFRIRERPGGGSALAEEAGDSLSAALARVVGECGGGRRGP